MSTPAMRLKTHWFKSGVPKSAAEQASAMAFIVFRVAQHTLKRMRGADFDIDAGPPYFAFLREVLVFLVAVADRMAHARLAPQSRQEFTVALVRHLARTLQENEDRLLGVPAAHEPSHADTFIDLVNEVTQHYAEFGADPEAAGAAGFQPDFAFVRYLGHRLEPTLPEKDRRWVIEQVMAAEAPEAVATLQRSMNELHDPAPRRARRAALSGE
ncbi:MAG: hypothetical protein KA141_01730 [Rubrivivax sp.]|jgi:hypothetical protein|nr:hypothetical protein [Rubrivivax sp.]